LISSALAQLGAEVSCFSLPDDPQPTQQLLARLAAEVDVIISTGGVSAGEEDHVKTSVAALGQVQFWKIAMKPGKPFMFGRIETAGRATPILGLPGNPVSSFITYALLAKPFVQACQGMGARLSPARLVPIAQALVGGGRDEFLRVESTPQGLVPLANQSSGRLSSLQQAGGVMRLAAGASLQAGDLAEFWPLAELLAP
jgi:molybdopterin molybdotransferase